MPWSPVSPPGAKRPYDTQHSTKCLVQRMGEVGVYKESCGHEVFTQGKPLIRFYTKRYETSIIKGPCTDFRGSLETVVD